MEPYAEWVAHERYVLGLAFAPDDVALYSCGMEGDINRWRLSGLEDEPGPEIELSWRAHAKSINSLALSRDGNRLVSGSTDRTVVVWDAVRGVERVILTDRAQTVAKVSWDANDQHIGAAWYGGRVTVWDADGGLVMAAKASNKNQVALAFAPEGDTVVSGGLGDDITVWSLADGGKLATLSGHETAVLACAFIGPGRMLSLGYEGTIKRWDMPSKTSFETWPLELGNPRGMIADALRGRVAVAGEGRVLILSMGGRVMPSGAILGVVDLPVKAVGAMAFSHDGRTLAIGTADRRIRLYKTP